MAIGRVLIKKGFQAIQLPPEARLPEGVRNIDVRALGNELIIAPTVPSTWDSFFKNGPATTDDFMPERAAPKQDG